jgi:hypothetical protein
MERGTAAELNEVPVRLTPFRLNSTPVRRPGAAETKLTGDLGNRPDKGWELERQCRCFMKSSGALPHYGFNTRFPNCLKAKYGRGGKRDTANLINMSLFKQAPIKGQSYGGRALTNI